MSKVCSVLSEELSFKVEELVSVKEVQKYASSKEELLDILKQLEAEGLVKSCDSGEFLIVVKDEEIVYNLANIRNKMSKSEILTLLGLKESEIKRLYKQSLFWVLVVEDSLVNQNLQSLLNSKSLKVNDAEIKFDFNSGKNLRRSIVKKTHHLNYIKETDDLKASPQGKRKESYSKAGYNSNTSNTSEHFSWRKKSDVSTNSKDEYDIFKKVTSAPTEKEYLLLVGREGQREKDLTPILMISMSTNTVRKKFKLILNKLATHLLVSIF
jgi:hypothetical protein